MLVVTAINGQSEPLANVQDLQRKRRINGEKELSFSLLSDDTDVHGFRLVQELSTITFEGERYVIDQLEEVGYGDRTMKNIEAVHEFFPKMIDSFQYVTTSGTKTFAQILGFVFDGTDYTFSIIDSFSTQTFENFGNDNRLALFQKALEAFNAEFELIGSVVRLKTQIGTETDFQFRYGFNIKTFFRTVDTKDLTTYVKGFGQPMVDGNGSPTGNYVVQGEYSSPYIAVLGKREATPVYDDTITSLTELTKVMQAAIQDTPLLTLKLDFVDLRAAGYPYIIPNEGDYVWVIYEPMDGLTMKVRITEVEETFGWDLNPIATTVTLATMRKDITDTIASFNGTSKTVNKVITPSGTIKTDILSEDVKNATRAISSAMTELVFQNGIRAIDAGNPNKIVVFTSAGIGISDDGGNTYRSALTGEGMVAEVLTSGVLNTNNVRIEGDTQFYWDGTGIIAQDPMDIDKFLRISKQGIQITTDGGVTFQTAIDADGVVANSLTSTGSIDVETDIRVGNTITIGQNWQDTEAKTIEFNGLGGGCRIVFSPLTDELNIGAINGIKMNRTVFSDNTYRTGAETGMCGVGGWESTQTTGPIAGVYVQFKHKRLQAPTNITFTTVSSYSGITPQVANITVDGFWLYINGANFANGYRYWRGTYTTVN